MPRFYFDTHDGQTTLKDVYGIDLIDENAARDIAVKALPDMAKEAMPDDDQQTLAVHVRSERDEVVLNATLVLEVDWKQGDAASKP